MQTNISVYTDLTSEDKVPLRTSHRGTTNKDGERERVKSFVPFHAKRSGSGLANPWVSNTLAENHKHLIVSLTFSAKRTYKEL